MANVINGLKPVSSVAQNNERQEASLEEMFSNEKEKLQEEVFSVPFGVLSGRELPPMLGKLAVLKQGVAGADSRMAIKQAVKQSDRSIPSDFATRPVFSLLSGAEQTIVQLKSAMPEQATASQNIRAVEQATAPQNITAPEQAVAWRQSPGPAMAARQTRVSSQAGNNEQGKTHAQKPVMQRVGLSDEFVRLETTENSVAGIKEKEARNMNVWHMPTTTTGNQSTVHPQMQATSRSSTASMGQPTPSDSAVLVEPRTETGSGHSTNISYTFNRWSTQKHHTVTITLPMDASVPGPVMMNASDSLVSRRLVDVAGMPGTPDMIVRDDANRHEHERRQRIVWQPEDEGEA